MMWSPLFHHLLGRQWVETQIQIARRRDVVVNHRYDIDPVVARSLGHKVPDRCICGDPKCEKPWQDGGRPVETGSGEGRRPEFTR